MGDNSMVDVVAAFSTKLCVSDSIPCTGFNTWIIDTSASDHMTYDAKFFNELSSNTRDPYITSANGLPSPITGEGTISLTPTLPLSHALLVPNIHCNLLSVGRLLDTLNASATFYILHIALFMISRLTRRLGMVLDFKTLHDVFGNHVSPVSVSKLPPKVFGYVAYVHVYSHQWSKLDPCALRCVFIGYSYTQKDYKCYHPPTQKVHENTP
ncbi:hypothetical protein L3X38_003885 [Prunus dulcis]|uniref:Retrovirus-related Pol polyprotein from transposon RE2 n=1 Tax=Prunus dulcis TaxID=3755 RepID=A0AAD4ZMY8_PRUDU|nr:hypothetical protein L3X38_003885 [Prunus dulcis]